jgi:glyoxylase-like metal-dependent hydrolase (beta-lactamase superfamily II)
MIHHRHMKGVDYYQLLEFVGPTHPADIMLPKLTAGQLACNSGWLCPKYWSPASNRIVLSMHLNVIKAGSEIVIVDCGVGNFKRRPPSPSQDNLNTPVLDWLRAIDCPPERVNHVVMTHLHGDHVGWNTVRQGDRWVPTFPNATYYFPEVDWNHFSKRFFAGVPDPKGSFEDSILPIACADRMKLINGGDEIAGLLTGMAAPGHTPGQLVYTMKAGDETCLFAADTMHHPIQVMYPHVSSRACEDGETAHRTRVSILQLAADTGCDVLPAHYFGTKGWRITRSPAGFDLEIPANEF